MNKWGVDEHKQCSEKVRCQRFCLALLDKIRNYEGIWSNKRKSFVKPVGMNCSNFKNETLFVSFTATVSLPPEMGETVSGCLTLSFCCSWLACTDKATLSGTFTLKNQTPEKTPILFNFVYRLKLLYIFNNILYNTRSTQSFGCRWNQGTPPSAKPWIRSAIP